MASTSKRKRVVLSIGNKLDICSLVKKGLMVACFLTSVVCRGQIVGKSTIYDIVKSEEKLISFQTEVEDGDCIKKSKIVRSARSHEMHAY